MKNVMFGLLGVIMIASPVVAQTATVASAGAAVAPKRGMMLTDGKGVRLAPVSRVEDSGVQIIFEGNVVRIPVTTLSLVGGKLATSLSKNEILAMR